MSSQPKIFAAALGAPPDEVFATGEQCLLVAFERNVKSARLLLNDEKLVVEARLHSLFAAECLLKHFYCLIRHTAGVKANVPEDFRTLKFAREFGHNIKKLGAAVLKFKGWADPNELEKLMLLLPVCRHRPWGDPVPPVSPGSREPPVILRRFFA